LQGRQNFHAVTRAENLLAAQRPGFGTPKQKIPPHSQRSQQIYRNIPIAMVRWKRRAIAPLEKSFQE
jgi:hypothetical protein